jgi:hypothetical protein
VRALAPLLALGLVTGCAFDPSGLGGAAGGDPAGGQADGGGGGGSGGGGGGGGGQGSADAAPGAPDAATSVALTLTAPRASIPPLLDGEALGSWLTSSFIRFDIADAALTTDVNPQYQNSAAVEFAALHDDDNLYFFLRVEDSEKVDDSDSPRQDDAVVLYIDGAGDRSGPYGNDDHAIVLTLGAEVRDYPDDVAEVSGTRLLTPAGYNIEVAISKSSLYEIAPDGHLGFDLAIIDDDGLGNPMPDAVGLWTLADGPRCGADCCPSGASPWCDTTMFGQLVLVD